MRQAAKSALSVWTMRTVPPEKCVAKTLAPPVHPTTNVVRVSCVNKANASMAIVELRQIVREGRSARPTNVPTAPTTKNVPMGRSVNSKSVWLVVERMTIVDQARSVTRQARNVQVV